MPFTPLEFKLKNIAIYVVEIKHFLELKAYLSDKENEELNQIQFPHRKNEFATTRALRHHLFQEQEILYSENGAPFMLNQCISIAHSKDYVALAVSKNQVGLDIEHLDERINRVFPKIATDDELNWFTSPLQKTQLWTCKEAMFKYYKTEKNIYSMYVVPHLEKENTFVGNIKNDTKKAPLEIKTLILEKLNHLVLSVAF
jgi:4'-phosphopantetheinyl transferase EntD